jgi:uncharacterized protein DUF3551
MRITLSVATAAALGLVATSISSAKAEISYPWCALYGDHGMRNCGFSTLEQCRAAISGNGGYCEPNLMYRPAAETPPYKPRR